MTTTSPLPSPSAEHRPRRRRGPLVGIAGAAVAAAMALLGTGVAAVPAAAVSASAQLTAPPAAEGSPLTDLAEQTVTRLVGIVGIVDELGEPAPTA